MRKIANDTGVAIIEKLSIVLRVQTIKLLLDIHHFRNVTADVIRIFTKNNIIPIKVMIKSMFNDDRILEIATPDVTTMFNK